MSYVSLYEQRALRILFNGTHDLLDENQNLSLGDFWRVLRVRPSANMTKMSYPDLEYVPNNTYTYYQVKKTLLQMTKVEIKPTRYWSELPVKDVTNDVLGSLSEFCPRLPIDANIIQNNINILLPPFRIVEVQALLACGALPG
jgi:hypothetical protein